MFGVSTRTIRKAYHMLEEGGYLSISRGRNAVVIRGAPGGQCREVCVAYFAARRDAILDLSWMAKKILPEIFLRGFLMMDGEGLDGLALSVEKMRIQNLQTQLQCFCRILAPLGNPLLTSFFWEISVFSRMTYLRGLFTDEAENERDSENLAPQVHGDDRRAARGGLRTAANADLPLFRELRRACSRPLRRACVPVRARVRAGSLHLARLQGPAAAGLFHRHEAHPEDLRRGLPGSGNFSPPPPTSRRSTASR